MNAIPLSSTAGPAPSGFISLVTVMSEMAAGREVESFLKQEQHGLDLAGLLMGMAVMSLLTGDGVTYASLQTSALRRQQYYRLLRGPSAPAPALRLLALMGPGDLSENTPLEFLLEGSDVELSLLYLAADLPLPTCLPEHDVCMVAIAPAEGGPPLLEAAAALLRGTDKPVFNRPERIAPLLRDRVSETLQGIAGLAVPRALRVARALLDEVGAGRRSLADVFGEGDTPVDAPGEHASLVDAPGEHASLVDVPGENESPVDAPGGQGFSVNVLGGHGSPINVLGEGGFPVIVRPLVSHTGQGLARIASRAELVDYLAARGEADFFVAPFIDYASADGQYRKYRIALIGGRPHLCHLAISSHWMVHYVNADMAGSADKRAEEEAAMAGFERDFAPRHAGVWREMTARLGLDYAVMDCAELPDGSLLLFELDNVCIVHAMDNPVVYPYKRPHMAGVFAAFRAMLAAPPIADT